jgi:hypothetical protein
MLFNKKQTPIIEFSCKEWAIRKHAPVLPSIHFLPKEYEDLPAGNKCPFDHFQEASLLSIKLCPAVGNYLNAGYVIPAWCDIEITFEDNNFRINYSNLNYQHRTHPEEQFKGMFDRFKMRTDIKLDSPWAIKTAPGYSVMWMPMWFHNNNFQAVPSIVDTDSVPNHNPINIMLFEAKTTIIKMGDPLVQVIPFKREHITGVSREYTEADYKRKDALMGLGQLSKYGWRQFIKKNVKYLLDRKDLDLP